MVSGSWSFNSYLAILEKLEVAAGIEPAYAVLQTAA